MVVIVRSNNNPVNDLTALMSGLINDLNKVIKIDCALNEATMNGCTLSFFHFAPIVVVSSPHQSPRCGV